jgi:hypothetical protein
LGSAPERFVGKVTGPSATFNIRTIGKMMSLCRRAV